MTFRTFINIIALWACAGAEAQTVGGYKVVAPEENGRFITDTEWVGAPNGLDGKHIAIWQSHGWYFEPKLNRWEWQRARIFETVEDLYTQSYVMPYVMPMLENAGAYVMSPRERDTNTTEIIVDNDGGMATGTYSEHNAAKKWKKAPDAGFGYTKARLENGDNPFVQGTARQIKTVTDADKASLAKWSANIPKNGDYAVYVSYQSLKNSATDATYTIHTTSGDRRFKVNQQMGGGTWIYLGHFPLAAGDGTIVELSNLSAERNAIVSADAVKIGGGMGNVARKVKGGSDEIEYEYMTSGYPRFTEGARYWLQWAGAPESVYTPSDNVNDYTDDYKCRGEWVNWLAGGSSVLPDRQGLGIPVDMSFAFHSDAGTTLNDSIIGTLGIYYSNKGGKYANGTERKASGVLTDYVMSQIVNDVRKQYEPQWTRRDMWDKSYFEARVPEVPAMLLELLSHQNFADMKYGLDPTFRFTVSRAIYKGMLRFLSERDGKAYVVQPLPVQGMSISYEGNNHYVLSWRPTVDSLESTAMPDRYIIEERVNDGGWRKVITVDTQAWAMTITDNDIHSYRVTAVNDGGKSFPSEVLALCNMGDSNPVLIVNGFTRVSGPDWFDSGEIAGFYDTRDHGVPYMSDISYIGAQFEFRRDIPWMDDDAAGFGASRANYETQVIAGNTFDYVYTHGAAIKNGGRGFVSASVDAYINGSTYPATDIDLILGKQKEIKVGRGVYGTKYKTFTPALQLRLTDHCKSGGNLFVTGSYIATDLWDNDFSTESVRSADQAFASDILGYKWRVGQASVTGEAYQVPCRYKALSGGNYTFYNTLNSEGYAVESPDSFYPSDDNTGATFMRYAENNLIAGTALDNGTWKTVAIGFPFESIKSASERDHLMKEVLNFFEQK